MDTTQRKPHRRFRMVLIGCLFAILLGWLVIPQCGLDGNPGCFPLVGSCTRILFIGDSYTIANDLPATFANLSWSAGYRVQAGILANGGETLAQHVADPATLSTLTSTPWNIVVLQEQSQLPAYTEYLNDDVAPAVGTLSAEIRSHGATPLLFLTWAHEDGWAAASLPTYLTMQAAIDTGYLSLSATYADPIAPVGYAWQSETKDAPSANLWLSDETHPTVEGTYLAACVFYAEVFHRSPVGLSYTDGLPPPQARQLQSVAATTVLTQWATWNPN